MSCSHSLLSRESFRFFISKGRSFASFFFRGRCLLQTLPFQNIFVKHVCRRINGMKKSRWYDIQVGLLQDQQTWGFNFDWHKRKIPTVRAPTATNNNKCYQQQQRQNDDKNKLTYSIGPLWEKINESYPERFHQVVYESNIKLCNIRVGYDHFSLQVEMRGLWKS